jgi:hypothetical protein
MFTTQIGTLIQALIGTGMDARQADAFSMLGNCTAPLQHAGPIRVDYEWPTNADLEDHAALTLNTQGTALNIPMGDARIADGTLYVDYIAENGGTPTSTSLLGGGYVAILQANLTVGGSATARVASRSSGSWAEASPIVSLTVYDAFLSGSEIIPSGYRVWVQREIDGNKWVVTSAKAN